MSNTNRSSHLNNTSINKGCAWIVDNYFFEPINKIVNHERIVDTSATNHVIGEKNLLKSDTSIENVGKVQLPTRESTPITHVGSS